MGFDLRLPNINGTTEREMLVQIKNFLYQHIEQLQWALNILDASNNTGVATSTAKNLTSSQQTAPSAEATSGSIKATNWWVNLGLSSSVTVSNSNFGRYTNGTCCYRVVNENHVYVAFNCSFTYSGEAITVNASEIPSPYKPARNVYALCPVNNRGIALILVNPSGEVRIDWVQNIASAEATEADTVNWIDGYIDYWV